MTSPGPHHVLAAGGKPRLRRVRVPIPEGADPAYAGREIAARALSARLAVDSHSEWRAAASKLKQMGLQRRQGMLDR
jgi:hypothetical protein